MRRDDDEQHLSKKSLLLWGLLYCKSDVASKSKYFYDSLQDSQDQNSIAATDKDFPPAFSLILELSVKLVNTYEMLVSKS